jgi:hypothetical protein
VRTRTVKSRLAERVSHEPQHRRRAPDTSRKHDPQGSAREHATPAHDRRSAIGALALIKGQQVRGALDDRRRFAQIDSPDRDIPRGCTLCALRQISGSNPNAG